MESSVVQRLAEFQEVPRKMLYNIVIFRTGQHTDSSGHTEDFSQEQVRSMVNSFFSGHPASVPIKLGHVSEEFLQKLSDELQVPPAVLQGEGPNATGAARLGEVRALHSNHVVTADLALHPKVADLVSQGFFTANSPEIQFNRKEGDITIPVALSALSLLGAQRPALKGNPPLQQGILASERASDGQLAKILLYHEPESWAPHESQYESGSLRVDPNLASSGDPDAVEWVVPVRDLGRGTFVQASVSAPNEATAKNVALRVVENFLFNVTGPLGKILGATAGIILGKRLLVGQPKRVPGAGIGNISWRLSEPGAALELLGGEKQLYSDGPFTLGEEIIILPSNYKEENPTMTQPKFNLQTPEGVSEEAWNSCLARAREQNVENPEQHCREQLMAEMKASEERRKIAGALGLSEASSLEEITAALSKQKHDNASFEERLKHQETQTLTFKYQQEVSTLSLVPGTTQELTQQLVERHQKYGEQEATARLNELKALQRAAEDAGVTKLLLNEGDGQPKETPNFMSLLSEAQQKPENKDKNYGDLFAEIARLNPESYAEYREHSYSHSR